MGVTDQSVTQTTHEFGHGVVHDRHVSEFFNILLKIDGGGAFVRLRGFSDGIFQVQRHVGCSKDRV